MPVYILVFVRVCIYVFHLPTTRENGILEKHPKGTIRIRISTTIKKRREKVVNLFKSKKSRLKLQNAQWRYKTLKNHNDFWNEPIDNETQVIFHSFALDLNIIIHSSYHLQVVIIMVVIYFKMYAFFV